MTTEAATPELPSEPSAPSSSMVFSPSPNGPSGDPKTNKRKWIIAAAAAAGLAGIIIFAFAISGSDTPKPTTSQLAPATSTTIDGEVMSNSPTDASSGNTITTAVLTADSITTDPFSGSISSSSDSTTTSTTTSSTPLKSSSSVSTGVPATRSMPVVKTPVAPVVKTPSTPNKPPASTDKKPEKIVVPGRVRFEPLTDSIEILPGPVIDVEAGTALPMPTKGDAKELLALLSVLKAGKEEGVFMLSAQVSTITGLNRKAQCWPTDDVCGRLTLTRGAKVQMLVARTKGAPVLWYLEYLGQK